jgi:signal transduction histidine kinase/iron only hydrogenase large subunit-like protein
MKSDTPLIQTVGELCRVCYTCVRDCPAKAIRISNGQAEVLAERCIGCGNCVRVCSQCAKKGYDSTGEARALLHAGAKTAAILAPSFPAEFTDIPAPRLVAMLRALGFDSVHEVAFGADLVAAEYRRLLASDPERRWIATTCPGVVAYVEKYHPDLVESLAPVASPMVAEARALKALYGAARRIVFIGPCLAKKVEGARASERSGDIDAVLTFHELRGLFGEARVTAENAGEAAFDPPHPGLGMLFSISRGMLQAANIPENLLDNTVVAAEGQGNFEQAIKEFESGAIDARLLEVLCCDGCIMGSGMSVKTPLFSRRAAVSRYARDRMSVPPDPAVREAVRRVDLSMAFEANDHRLPVPSEKELRAILDALGKSGPGDELNCGACGYETCRDHAIAIFKGLAENEMCLPNTIDRLKQSLTDLNLSNEQLASTRQALINAEKLASMGQLAAGIAHEVNNPLGVILLYAKLMLDEVSKESESYRDLLMISEQAERCKKIVTDLLNFARRNKVARRDTNLCDLIDRCVKTILVPDRVTVRVDHDLADPVAEVDPDQIVQVMTNLVSNAAEAMGRRGEIAVRTRGDETEVVIQVEDAGSGIAEENLKKIFEPLFTTKTMGQGTGLGLSVTFGIIKMHRGRIDVQTNADPEKGPTGTTFTVTLPRRAPDEEPESAA